MPKKISEAKNENEKSPIPSKIDEEIKSNPISSFAIQSKVLNKAEQMKEYLDGQPKVSIMIPLEKGEKKGAFQPFCINGYRFKVLKGVMTPVPEQVAQMVSERFNIELETRSQSLGQKSKETRDALD